MPKTYACPCCDGQGLVHAESTEAEPLECVECDSTGQVTREQREDLLSWRHKCRLRPRAAEAPAGKSPQR